MNRERHALAGKTVTLRYKDDPDHLNGQEYRLEDWWTNVAGQSWMWCQGNPACLKYAIRGAMSGLPTDNEVVYGKVGPFGHLVHESELVYPTVGAV